MTHPREHIRKALVNYLKTAVNGEFLTMAKNNVYANRAKPLFEQFMPAILLYTQEENVEEERWDGDGYSPLKRKLSIDIEAIIVNTGNIDNDLDLFAWQIENALDGWDVPLRGADILRLKQTDSSIAVDGNKVYGVVRLTYSLIYRTAVKQP